MRLLRAASAAKRKKPTLVSGGRDDRASSNAPAATAKNTAVTAGRRRAEVPCRVEDGRLIISLTASPLTWLNGFVDTLVIRGSETLPIPDDALLDLSGSELYLEGGNRAIFVVPLEAGAESMFFRVGTHTRK